MKTLTITMISLLLFSCSPSPKEAPTESAQGGAVTHDTSSIATVTVQINNVDYSITRINQWSYGSSGASVGPVISTSQLTDWPVNYVHFRMYTLFRNINCSFPADSFVYIDLAAPTSIDSVVIEAIVTPASLMSQPWATYSNFRRDQQQWLPESNGRVGINRFLPCPYANPGHGYDMNVVFQNVELFLVDSSGALSGWNLPRKVLVRSAAFRTIKD